MTTILKTDTYADVDPRPVWGPTIYAADPSRIELHRDGGPNDLPFRRHVVLPGDYDPNPPTYGYRSELGYNSTTESAVTFWRYEKGDRRTTRLAIRLAPDYPTDDPRWKLVWQMKQCNPTGTGKWSPVLSMLAQGGHFVLRTDKQDRSHRDLWTGPARVGEWNRWHFDTTYDNDPAAGGMILHRGKREWDLGHFPTLLTEVSDGQSTPKGSATISHLRVGPYADPTHDRDGLRLEVDYALAAVLA